MPNNRNKGHNAERYYRSEFIKLGYVSCLTARYGSRYMDDLGIDLMHLPFNVQVKAGKLTSMNPPKLLAELKKRIANSSLVEEVKNYPLLLLHKLDAGRGKKRQDYHEIVSMLGEDFSKLMIGYPTTIFIKKTNQNIATSYNKVKSGLAHYKTNFNKEKELFFISPKPKIYYKRYYSFTFEDFKKIIQST